MTPSAFQVPPRPLGTSAMTCTGPPATSARFSFPLAKNPMDRFSADQNGNEAPSVPLKGCGVTESKVCRKSCLVPLLSATYTTYLPLGDICGLSIPCFDVSGGCNVPRITGFASEIFRQRENPTQPSAIIKTAATPQATCSRFSRLCVTTAGMFNCEPPSLIHCSSRFT